MAILIGQAEPGFNDPVGLMTACHRRIERFLGTLCHIARNRKGTQPDAAEAAAFQTALRYFRDAAPHHTADEEDDLFPALVRAAPEASASVEALEQDHRRAERLHAEVDQLGLAWLRDGSMDKAAAGRLVSALEELTALYREHIRMEEQELFPRATRCLAGTVFDSIGRQMAARRGVPYIPDSVVPIAGTETR